MTTTMRPLGLQLIEEGLFLQQADADLRGLERELVAFRREHGKLAVGAKAKLTVEITLTCAKEDDNAYYIKALTKKAMPARPANVTVGIAGETDEDGDCLFVRASGSTPDSPKQAALATQDGRTIDPETGEVVGVPPATRPGPDPSPPTDPFAEDNDE